MLKPHIVILGSGFGGTYVAKQLVPHVKKGRIEVTIINSTNYFLFTPLLHEVATGSLGPTSVAEPLREIFASTGVRDAAGRPIQVSVKLLKLSTSGFFPSTHLSIMMHRRCHLLANTFGILT